MARKKRGSFVKSLPSGWLQMDWRLCDTWQKESQCRVFSFGVRGGRGNEDIFECMHCSRRVCRSIDLQLGCMPAEAPSSPLTVPRRAAGELCCVSDTNTDGCLSKYYPAIHHHSFLNPRAIHERKTFTVLLIVMCNIVLCGMEKNQLHDGIFLRFWMVHNRSIIITILYRKCAFTLIFSWPSVRFIQKNPLLF